MTDFGFMALDEQNKRGGRTEQKSPCCRLGYWQQQGRLNSQLSSLEWVVGVEFAYSTLFKIFFEVYRFIRKWEYYLNY